MAKERVMSRFMLAACVAVILLGPGAVRGEDQQFTVRERVGERSPEVSFDFKDAKFPDVIDYFAKQSGANILVDGEIAETVTLRLVGVKWRRALDMVCQQVGAVVEEEGDQVLRISRPLTVNFELEDAPLAKVVGTIAKLAEATVIIGPNVKGVVTAQFYDAPWTQALDYIVRTSGFVALSLLALVPAFPAWGMALLVIPAVLSVAIVRLRTVADVATLPGIVEASYAMPDVRC